MTSGPIYEKTARCLSISALGRLLPTSKYRSSINSVCEDSASGDNRRQYELVSVFKFFLGGGILNGVISRNRFILRVHMYVNPCAFLRGVYSDTTQLNWTDPVEQRTANQREASQSCYCLWRHKRAFDLSWVQLSWVELCRYKHPFTHCWALFGRKVCIVRMLH